MRLFLKFLVIACLGLLIWWQISALPAHRELETLLLLGSAGLTAVLVSKDHRAGFWLALLLGLGHLLRAFLTLELEKIQLILPFIAWCVLAIAGSALLLALTGERRQKPPAYERFPEF